MSTIWNQGNMNSLEFLPSATDNFSHVDNKSNGDAVVLDESHYSSPSSQLQFPAETTPMPQANTTVIVVLVGILFVSLVINLTVLYSVTSLPKRKLKRPATILVAHLSSIAILFAFLCVMLVGESVSIVHLSGQGMCELVSFLKSTILGIFSLNIIAIIYERFRVFNCFNRGNLLLCRLITLIWITAVVASIPTIFTVVYKEYLIPTGNHEKIPKGLKRGMCKSIPLLDMFEVTVVYEFLRFILFHVLVVCYMAYAIYKIRSKLANLHLLKPTPNEQMRKKVQSIRFIYIHFVIFILIWLPFGALAFTYRVMNRKPSASPTNPIIATILGLLLYLYLVLNPLIYLCLDVGCCFCLRSKQRSLTDYCLRRNGQENGSEMGSQNNFECDKNQVNELGSKYSVENVTEMEGENDRLFVKAHNKGNSSSISRETGTLKRQCGSLVELHSLDMSRVSTYAVSSASSFNNV